MRGQKSSLTATNGSSFEILAIRTLGGLSVRLGDSGQPLHFETRTVEALLVYLACHPRPVGRDILAELLWPERSQEQARANLSVAIHRLRRQLAPYLLVNRQTLALHPDAMLEVDAAQFDADLNAGRLGAAIAWYDGDFLDGFYLDSSPAFEEWALLERERLRIAAIAAFQQHTLQQAAAGQDEAAIASAQRLLQLDPLHEPTHRQLMRLLAQSGQRSAALAQYALCHQLLSDELGVPPDATTAALSAQIRAGFWESGGPEKPPPVKPDVKPATRPTLPALPTPFIGRSVELARIEAMLANPDCRLLTLIGPGGIGKSSLAIETANRQADNFVDGVCFVALAPLERSGLVLGALAQSLGLQTTTSHPQAEIGAYLRPRQLLLIFDNFEHLLADADVVGQLLRDAPQVKTLVTSRESLHLREEWLLPLTGLSQAEGTTSEAAQLFLRSAQRVQPGFTGQEQEEAIAAICQQVEGIPLALELAASWVRVMSCAHILHQIGEDIDFLTSSLRNLPERQRSIRALFDHSWRLLAPLEQEILMRLSVFRSGWRGEAAAEVAGATLQLLAGLVDKSLVRMVGENRFGLHFLVRQYAAERLEASGEKEATRQRHCAAYLQLFRVGDSHLRGADAEAWLARLEAENDNLRAAVQWSLDDARYTDTAWLLIAAGWFWGFRGQWNEPGMWLVQLIPHRQKLESELRLATLLTVYSEMEQWKELQPVERWTDEVMELLGEGKHSLLHALAWFWMALHTADFSQATAAWEKSIAAARAASEEAPLGSEFCLLADQDFMLVSCLCDYASSLIQRGEVTRAIPLLTESLAIFRRRENRYEIGDGLGMLGLVALLQGDLALAQQHLREAVAIATAVQHPGMLVYWQPLWGLVTLYRGDAVEARRLLDEALGISLDMKNSTRLARVCSYLAELALWEERPDEAANWLAQSLGYQADAQRVTIYTVQRLFVAARLAAAQANYLRAATLFGLVDQMHNRIHYAIAGPMRSLADATLAIAQAALDPLRFDEAFAAGQRLSLEDAFAGILAADSISGLPKATATSQ